MSVLFDPKSELQQMIAGTQVSLNSRCEVSFMPGWKNIVEKFVNAIALNKVELTKVSDKYSFLEIEFDPWDLDPAEEVNVWRTVYGVKKLSMDQCVACGEFKSSKWKSETVHMFCEECAGKTMLEDKTGTWLDKY